MSNKPTGSRFNVVKGDQVLVRQGGPESLPYVAKITNIRRDGNLDVLWFYRPEDISRRAYHGERELFESDHKDVIHPSTLLGKCTVWSLDEFRDLDCVTTTDFFSRYSYCTRTKRYSPADVPVYCTCQLPENPDLAMVQCGRCKNWYHFSCEGMAPEQVGPTDSYLCKQCTYLGVLH